MKVVQLTNFEEALTAVKQGKRAYRQAWGDSDKDFRKCIVLITPEEPYTSFLAISYPQGHDKYPQGLVSPWTPTRCDLLEEDWYIL